MPYPKPAISKRIPINTTISKDGPIAPSSEAQSQSTLNEQTHLAPATGIEFFTHLEEGEESSRNGWGFEQGKKSYRKAKLSIPKTLPKMPNPSRRLIFF